MSRTTYAGEKIDNAVLIGATLLIAAGIALVFTPVLGAIRQHDPVTLECSVDDDLSFVAFNVIRWQVDGNTLDIHTTGQRYVRHMPTNETCTGLEP